VKIHQSETLNIMENFAAFFVSRRNGAYTGRRFTELDFYDFIQISGLFVFLA
jgi:hypothetical protein